MRTLLLSLILCASTTQTLGQTNPQDIEVEKRALIRQITNKIQLDTLIEKQISALVTMVKGQIPIILAEASIPESRQSKATTILAKELDAIYVPLVAASKQITVDAYANAFTLHELKDLLAFYNTPTGKKLVATLPQLQAQGMQSANLEGQKLAAGAMCKAFSDFNKQGIHSGMPPFCK